MIKKLLRVVPSVWQMILAWMVGTASIVLLPNFTAAIEQSHQIVHVGDTICVNGYVMDSFCIYRGNLFDNPSVSTLGPKGPLLHTVHCLIDVPQCVQSPFEILYDLRNSSGIINNNNDQKERAFGRAWRVVNNGLLIAHAKEVGECDECTGDQVRGLTATIFAEVLDLGNPFRPSLIKVKKVEHGNIGCGGIVYEVPKMII